MPHPSPLQKHAKRGNVGLQGVLCVVIFIFGMSVGCFLHSAPAPPKRRCGSMTNQPVTTPPRILVAAPSQPLPPSQPGFNCSRLSSVRSMMKLGSGITKSAFRISLGTTDFVVKRVSTENPDARTRMGVYKLLKEAHILQVLQGEHPNVMRVEGVCIFLSKTETCKGSTQESPHSTSSSPKRL